MSKSTPAPAGQGRFGMPKPKRVEEFSKLLQAPAMPTLRIEFQGRVRDIPTIRVAIGLPKYRLANGRTTSLQEEYLAEHPELPGDFFERDPELLDVQQVQHALLMRLAQRSDLQKHFEDTRNKQLEQIILDENGFVVNGNRRLACWRELLHDNTAKYGHFAHIDVAVLPHCDERDIDRLEAKLQIEQDIKADYSWDARANMIKAKMDRDGFTTKEIADMYKMSPRDVEELLDMRDYADEYLVSRGKKSQWSLVSEDEYAFRRLVKTRKKIQEPGDQDVFKDLSFTLIDDPKAAGRRVYEVIPEVMENLAEIKESVTNRFRQEPQPGQPQADQDVVELFGGAGTARPGIAPSLGNTIRKPENSGKVREIIIEAIERKRQLKKDEKSASFLLDCCVRAHDSLAAAATRGLHPESSREGVRKQLTEIARLAERIEKYLKEHDEDQLP